MRVAVTHTNTFTQDTFRRPPALPDSDSATCRSTKALVIFIQHIVRDMKTWRSACMTGFPPAKAEGRGQAGEHYPAVLYRQVLGFSSLTVALTFTNKERVRMNVVEVPYHRQNLDDELFMICQQSRRQQIPQARMLYK